MNSASRVWKGVMLQDQFGRKFEYLRLSITDVCNFKCNYCLPDGYDCSGNRDFMSAKEIATLVGAFAKLGTKKIRITGGEPGLRKDLSDIISLCKETEGVQQVGLTTNGFNLIDKVDEWHRAGLSNLNVSVDSLDPRMFNAITGNQKLQKVLDGIDKAVELGIKHIKLNAVLLKGFNLAQFDSYLEWIKQKALTVRFIELMETSDNRQFFHDNHVPGEQLKKQLLTQGWTQIIRDKLAGPAQEFCHPESNGKVGLIMPYSKDFCNSCNRLRVSSSGKLHLCLFADQGIDLRDALQRDDQQGVIELIDHAMGNKRLGHELQQHFTGATKHLAMLGG